MLQKRCFATSTLVVTHHQANFDKIKSKHQIKVNLQPKHHQSTNPQPNYRRQPTASHGASKPPWPNARSHGQTHPSSPATFLQKPQSAKPEKTKPKLQIPSYAINTQSKYLFQFPQSITHLENIIGKPNRPFLLHPVSSSVRFFFITGQIQPVNTNPTSKLDSNASKLFFYSKPNPTGEG